MSPSKSKKSKKSSHPWRENVEALSMAIVVALLFKYFILEISKIPSGSMQPTLMGDPHEQVFDRVVVDKLSYRFRDPKRWEIVVFKHPLERSRIMVKRLVGLPDEDLRIAGGDLWTRSEEGGDWTILRRPETVQEEMWRPLDLKEPSTSSWTLDTGLRGEVVGRSATLAGGGRLRFRARERWIRDGFRDGYPESLRQRGSRDKAATNPVGDLRIDGELEPDAAMSGFQVELQEGARTYVFHCPGPAAPADARPRISILGAGDDAPVHLADEPWRAEAGEAFEFRAQNIDDVLSLRIDGEEVLAVEISTNPNTEATVTLVLRDGGGELEDLMVYRDIYYTPLVKNRRSWETRTGEDQYLVLGDNTADSADSREWKFKRFSWEGPDGQPRSVRGNFREDENPLRGTGRDGEDVWRFRDEWGEIHWIPQSSARPEFRVPSPPVARHLIQGRALAVFWPLKPHKDLWRLTWLR